MIKQDQIDSMMDTALAFKDLIAVINSPLKIDEFVKGLKEAKDIIAQKNEILDAQDEVRKEKQGRAAILADIATRQDENTAIATANAQEAQRLAALASSLEIKDANLAALATKLDQDTATIISQGAATSAELARYTALNTELEGHIASANKTKEEYLAKLKALAAVDGGV